MIFLLLLACTRGDDGTEDTRIVDTQPDFITYPSQERVLFYDGHGGEPGDSVGNGGSDLAEAFISSEYGWQAERRDNLGEPEKFRAIVLMDPGVKQPFAFQDADVEKLQGAMKSGTRIAILVSAQNCAGATINPLLEKLGVAMRLNGEGALGTVISESMPGLQMTEGVSTVYLNVPCTVVPNGGETLLIDDRDVFAVSERPGWAGDVVLIGDYGWTDDTDQLDLGSNRSFLKRLVEVDPALTAQ